MPRYLVRGTDQKEYGPVGAEVLHQWVLEGRAVAGTMVRAEDQQEWQPLSALPEFAGVLGSLPPLPQPPPLRSRPVPAPERRVGLALASLILGILSLTCFSVVAGLPAIITGHLAHARARRSPDRFAGKGMALAGFILGYVSLLATCALVLWMVTREQREATMRSQVSCARNLKQICISARIYAADHDGRFPPDILTMSNELVTPQILWCPADRKHVQARSWAGISSRNITYEYLKPGLLETQAAETVVFRCPVHGTSVRGSGATSVPTSAPRSRRPSG